jgi:3-hydroxymyristoyl/3-hydroxydecanoyl-(acyl carrier protein) dehydratase
MIDPSRIFQFEGFEKSEGVASAHWLMPEACPYIDGHFPNQPVLPAVALLDGTLELIRRYGFALPPGQFTLKKAKFTGMVTPGMKVHLRLQKTEDRWNIEWRKSGDETLLASFSLRF